MKVLVIGGGGREHARPWKLAQSERVQRVYVAPGNGGTAADRRLVNVDITDPQALAQFAIAEKITLAVVGPEGPLSQGVVDVFRGHGLRIFGPTRAAAQLESSKAFSKDFMKRHGIPTAAYATFTDIAAGKGVVVATSVDEAHAAVDWMLRPEGGLAVQHNDAPRVVIEEFLAGEEASFIVMVDGQNVVALASSQDHKRLGDGDA